MEERETGMEQVSMKSQELRLRVWSWRQCSPVLKAKGDPGREGSKGNITLGNESWVPWSCLGGTIREEADRNGLDR